MVTQDSEPTRLLNLIAQLRARERELESELGQAKSDIEAVQRALALLRGQNGVPIEDAMQGISVESLKGMSYLAAITAIARTNNGKVKVIDAKRLLLEAGVSLNPKTAYQMITATLIRSNRFQRIAPGTYQLLSPKSHEQHSLLPRN
jgi:hypothetical protein